MGKKTVDKNVLPKKAKSVQKTETQKNAPTETQKAGSKKVAKKAEPAPAPVVEQVQVNNDSSSEHFQGNISSIFESLIAQNDNILNNQRQMLTTLRRVFKTHSRNMRDYEKNAARERRRAKKDPNRKKREPSGFAVPTSLSSKLCDFLGIAHSEKLSRTDVTRKVTSYIREQNLQVPENRRSFVPDKKLGAILGPLQEVDKGKGFTYFNLQRYITPHITSSAASSQ
uniref:DM2 domain-containing protein n=1 Tax=viral metagenome TaxID=1070528 RepID=A0A6C0JC67_9ZZZZ